MMDALLEEVRRAITIVRRASERAIAAQAPSLSDGSRKAQSEQAPAAVAHGRRSQELIGAPRRFVNMDSGLALPLSMEMVEAAALRQMHGSGTGVSPLKIQGYLARRTAIELSRLECACGG